MLVKKIIRKLYKISSNQIFKHIDLHRSSCLDNNNSIEYSFIQVKDLDISNINEKASEYLCDMYLLHCFDLLGSGFVKINYDMKCNGLHGKVYDGSLHITEFGENGQWLDQVILKLHKTRALDVWQHIDREYIPIDWQMDFKSGFRFSQKKWYLDQPIGKYPGVDIKLPWELCRLQHLPRLAVFAMTFPKKKEVILKEFRNEILDFIMVNPCKMGAAWTCAMDVAIRSANMLIAYDMFKQLDQYNILDEYFNKIFYSSVYEHGNFIINNLEWTKTFAGNHYLSDICGLVFISSYLKRNKEIDSWLAFSVQEMISETLKQFNEDGSNFEASTNYHRLSGELLVFSTALIYGVIKTDKKEVLIKNNYNINSADFFPIQYIERMYKAAMFTVDVTKPNKEVAQVGDNDSGRFFKFSPTGEFLENSKAISKYSNLKNYKPMSNIYFDENDLNHSTFVSAMSSFFKAEELKLDNKFTLEKSIITSLSKGKNFKIQPNPSEISLFSGEAPRLSYSSVKEIKYSDYTQDLIDSSKILLKAYPCFGIYIFRSENFFLSVMAGEIGEKGNDGHSHNDKLSFELNISGVDIYKDPGTYMYTPFPGFRNKFRSVCAHNAPIIEDEEQCRFTGPFSMKAEVKCKVIKFSKDSITLYLSYREIKILREFKLMKDKLVISDQCNKAFKPNTEFCKNFSNGYGKLIEL